MRRLAQSANETAVAAQRLAGTANENAATAKSTADAALEEAGEAKRTAQTAQQTADNAISGLAGKAEKAASPTAGHFAGLDSSGNLTDSGKKASDFAAASHTHSGYAEKAASPTAGNFASLDSPGNLTDSGKKASDFASASHTHAAGDIASGTLDLARIPTITAAKGGTGQTTAPSGLRALINACSALTDSTITSSDLLPVQDASDSTNAKKITLENLTTYIGANIPYGAKIQTGSYIGTGVYGSGNPNSITFNFAPKVVWCGDSVLRATTYSGDSGADMHYIGMLLTSLLTKTYRKDYGFGYSPGNLGTNAGIFGRISNDDKTIYWYNTIGPENQYNQSNKPYYWLAIV